MHSYHQKGMAMKGHTHDLTSSPDLQSHFNGTGPKRSQIPIYQDVIPPCNHACPAGENIQGWLSLAREEKMEEAWRLLTQDNPMPAIHGRVCYHPCEDHCNRIYLDNTLNIHAIERYLGDLALEKDWQFQLDTTETGKKILIVGAGPSGLSAAYHLRKAGHTVHVYEAGPVGGGMMHIGIPAYRLPRNILEKEIKRIENFGVNFHYQYKVNDLLAEKEKGAFDAVFIAIGAQIGKKIDIPQREAGKILDAISFLQAVEAGEKPKLGRRVAIYGGGNTAMDAARTAKRLGYEALIIYRRDMDHMPAHSFEANEAMAEGVKINWLRSIREINNQFIEVEEMKMDAQGKPVPTGRFETLEADSLILALGQDTDTRFLANVTQLKLNEDGTVQVDSNMMTGHEGIFAGGDMTPDQRSVTIATGHGKKAARYIDLYLKKAPLLPKKLKKPIDFDSLHIWYKTDAPQKEQLEIPVNERIIDFSEIKGGLTISEAIYEANRCLSCGNCFECDSCFGACPEDAILKLGKGNRYTFNYSLCTGCSVCFEQCPTHAIEMVGDPFLTK